MERRSTGILLFPCTLPFQESLLPEIHSRSLPPFPALALSPEVRPPRSSIPYLCDPCASRGRIRWRPLEGRHEAPWNSESLSREAWLSERAPRPCACPDTR